jgi:hypothetical protein
MKFRKWYAQFYAEPGAGEHDVWAPPAPNLDDGQPVFVPNDPTASRKHRTTG